MTAACASCVAGAAWAADSVVRIASRLLAWIISAAFAWISMLVRSAVGGARV